MNDVRSITYTGNIWGPFSLLEVGKKKIVTIPLFWPFSIHVTDLWSNFQTPAVNRRLSRTSEMLIKKITWIFMWTVYSVWTVYIASWLQYGSAVLKHGTDRTVQMKSARPKCFDRWSCVCSVALTACHFFRLLTRAVVLSLWAALRSVRALSCHLTFPVSRYTDVWLRPSQDQGLETNNFYIPAPAFNTQEALTKNDI